MANKLVLYNLFRSNNYLTNTSVRLTCIKHEQRRFLDLHEYQSKQILHQHGVKVQRFKVVENETQARQVLFPSETTPLKAGKWSGFTEDIDDSEEFVIKAQILAGGRGKGRFAKSSISGVQITNSHDFAYGYATRMLNDRLITKQTSSDGVLVDKVMIADAVRLENEYYFAIVFDRSYELGPIMIASPMGGMDIEEIAEKNEKAIRKFTVPLDFELDLDSARRIAHAAFDLDLTKQDVIDQCANQIMKLHKLFLATDATQIEINPLGVTFDREVICVDAKMKFDENAKFRHKWIGELEEMNKSDCDPRDLEAQAHNLNFIGLEGSIGCLVNGAGLAMATMDIIKLHGGEPANFLDVGGGASSDQVAAALRIIDSDKNVKAIFVNIFGGIMRCDTVAQGIIDAARVLNLRNPIVVRLEGTRVAEAKKLIEGSKLNITSCDDFDEAARMAITLSGSPQSEAQESTRAR